MNDEPQLRMIDVGSARLRTATWGAGTPEIVMLHDGLGSIPQWRNLPALICEHTGKTVMAYERPGHGTSRPIPTGPWPADWLHQQADLLTEVLAVCGIDSPLLVGHSDGGSTALIHATLPERNVSAIVSLAAHSWVEEICFESIVQMRANRGPIVIGLARSHDEPDAIFEAWSGVWVSDQFQSWDIRPELGEIAVPTLVAQGRDDAYATEAHATLTAEAIGPNATSKIVDDVGHIMHHDDADAVAELVADFVLAVTSIH